MTLRETAKQNVIDSVTEAATKQHERSYEKLHVNRDGTVSWFESSVCTRSFGCNCDYCNDCYDDGAIADAVGDSDLSGTEEQMLSRVGDIPLGYFNDEAESDIERARR